MQPRRLAILGVGLLGGSIGLAAKSVLNGCRIVGYGHRRSTLQAALDTGAIDEGYDRPEQAVRGADLVILCTPVALLSPLLEQVTSEIPDGARVTDVGSTKASIVESAERALGARAAFVGSHPMAGSEKRGVQYARADLFQNALCITTPTDRTDPAALADVEGFWAALGMRITRVSPDEHDRLLADVSHLPHAVAAAIVRLQREPALKLCGKGFLDLTRVAGGDGGLWRDILLDNRRNMSRSIDRLVEELRELRRLLDPAQAEPLKAWLDEAAERRNRLGGGSNS